MAIRVENGEHDFRKPACAEYCHIDPLFCPLCNLPVGDDRTKCLSIKIKRWTDLEEKTEDGKGKEYLVDYADKLKPEDQLPPHKPGEPAPEKQPLPDPSGIPDYAEKLRNERESFTPFSCWGDGSGFERDIMPENLVGPGGTMERLYDLNYYPIQTKPLQLGDWNTWVDKFQVDNRFAQVSDLNAETILFPNVDDPWMFTEYVFKGKDAGDIIVEPPLYDEETLKLKNPDKVLDEKTRELDKYQEFAEYPGEDEEEGEDGEEDEKSPKFVKSFRQVCHWDELNLKEDRRNNTDFSVKDSGGRLYRVDVPVQSVKWGEHGNIPPGTVNMGAPAEWMEASQSAARIRPTFVAHIGIPYYASTHGVVYWYAKDAFVDTLGTPQLQPGTKPFYSYSIKETGPHGVKQNTPKAVYPQAGLGRDGAKLANTYMPTGSISHGGCQLLKSQKDTTGNGKCYCSAMDVLKDDDPELEKLKSFFKFDACSTANENCPKFVSGAEYPILADYEGVAHDRAQYNEQVLGIYSGEGAEQRMWADNFLSKSTGTGADMLLAMGFGMSNRLGRPDIYNPTEVSVWYEAKFEVVYESENPVRLNKQLSSYDGFGRGIQVLRGTGKMALNTMDNSNAFRGDTVYFGDMDQVSFSRWFETPMFCAKAAYCNDICGLSMQQGFDPAQRAGSSEGSCRYYRSAGTKGANGHIGCPSTSVQKRALEFQETMTACTPALTSIANMWASLTEEERLEFNADPENPYFFEQAETAPEEAEIWSIWARKKDVANSLGGILLREEKEGRHLFAKIRLTKIPQCYFWYQALDNAGAELAVWFCKCDKDFVAFTRNTLIITNEDKFIGGYHPQYKDYSKIGPEYLQDVESDSYRDAMGDIIGDVDYDGQPQAMNKKGYWTDASGDYVVDENTIGANHAIATDDSRKEAGSPVTISFKKANTTVDAETGQMKRPKTVNCAVHSNDPFALMEEFSKGTRNPDTGKREGRPMLEDDYGSDPYWAPPSIRNRWALPTMRLAAHCPKCEYYISWRYHDLLCPWCDTRLVRIEGDKGAGMDVGSEWPQSASILRKFFKLNAIGKVQVWAPPGTCVPRDGYFWKNPTVVTNTMIRQIKYRLGEYKDNAWQGTSMTAASEFSLGYPEQMGYFKPIPDYVSKETDAGEIYADIEWSGVSKEDRSRYSSYNDIIPVSPLPGFASDSSNEAVIVPYTDASSDGLKMITLAEIIALRNRIEPVLAYCSELPGQNDFPRMRASYEKREEATVPRYMSRSHCRIPSVILATNDNGVDSHVQFWSGDYEWGTVREYYPPGLSWWWLNQLIGGKYSDLTGGYYHMDDGSPHSGGNRTVAKCAMFIHGILPLDKEILAAYLIVNPAGEPSKEPVGRGWNGIVHYSHYHAMTQTHFADGVSRHLHGQAGFKGNFDEEGNYTQAAEEAIPLGEITSPIVPMDESDYLGWAANSNRPRNYRSLYVSTFLAEWTGIPGVRDEGFWKQYGTSKVNVNSSQDPINSYDGDLNTGLKYNGRLSPDQKKAMKFKLIGLDKEGNLRQNYPTDDIWQAMTQDEMKEQISKNMINAKLTASDGNRQNDITASFGQFSEKFISAILPEQMQSIPGYFDLSGINSEMRLPDSVGMKSKENGGRYEKPVIIQEEGGGSSSYSGVTITTQSGVIPRAFDITKLFKEHYNARIDRKYYCKAGKTLKEVSEIKFEPPVWEGMGKWDDKEKAEKWNSQEKNSSFTGYLLNDDYSFPKLESDRSIPGLPSDGEQYQLAPKGIQLLCTFLLPFTIKTGSNHYWISENGAESEVKSLPAEVRITTTDAAVALLKTIFGSGYKYTVVSASSCLIEKTDAKDSDSLEIKECVGSCYGYFSIPTGNISGIQDRSAGVSSFANGFHPSGLAKGQPWVTNSYIFETQNAIFDLCRAPLEKSEKDYRYLPPTINCASCICPQKDCATQGKTAGVYASLRGTGYPDGQTSCPSCGYDLSGESGAVRKDGDSIYSWYYQDAFHENPFITGMEISVEEETSFRVSCRNSVSSTWTPLLNVVYDELARQYSYSRNGETVTSQTSPEKLSLDQDHWARARYIQIETDPKKGVEKLEYTVEQLNDYSVKATGKFMDMGLFDWGGLKCEIIYSADEEGNIPGSESKILSTVNLNDENTELTFYFQSNFDGKKVDKIILEPNRYTSKVKHLRAYGFHYKPSELTMTGPALEKFFLFSTKTSKYQLEEFPTQILAVSIGKNDSGGTVLTEADSKDSLKYQLTARTVPVVNAAGAYEGKIVYVISSGNYYFDPVRNQIHLPSCGEIDGKIIDLKNLEDNLAKVKENISFYPTRMSIRYWTGSGEPVTLDAQAQSQGPSFQVEKDTITFIESPELLPGNGVSVKMPDMNGKTAKRPIPWVCYNHIPATLDYGMQALSGGYFMPPVLKSTALGKTVDNDKFFVDLFGENLRLVRGTCKTQVTFYGAPDQVLSGTIWVKAPAYTTKIIDTGSNKITTKERTGGIEGGCFTVKVEIEPTQGRKTAAYYKPTIIVYAKERNPTDEF